MCISTVKKTENWASGAQLNWKSWDCWVLRFVHLQPTNWVLQTENWAQSYWDCLSMLRIDTQLTAETAEICPNWLHCAACPSSFVVLSKKRKKGATAFLWRWNGGRAFEASVSAAAAALKAGWMAQRHGVVCSIMPGLSELIVLSHGFALAFLPLL